MVTVLSSIFSVFASYLAVKLYSTFRTSQREKGLPPGPPTLPFIGNLHIFPRKQLHFKFTEWAREYGDIFSLKAMHLTVIVLNSPTAVKELIDKRGASTCNRPASIIADIITPDNLNIGSGRYANDTWKALRKAAVHMLRPDSMDTFKPYQRAEAAQLMWEMCHSPENFYEDISRYTTSFFMGIIYGIRAPRASTYASRTFTKMQLEFMLCMDVGKAPPVDLFPILNIVPTRFSGWKRRALDLKHCQEDLFNYLLDVVKARVTRGETNGSFLEEAYLNRQEWGLSDAMLLHLGGTLLEGSDTSSGIMQDIILLLIAHPEVQRKAQAEIDAVVGFDRPPDWEDLEHLPYMKAFIEECIRFRPIAPLALPHAVADAETYNGMFFPKDSVVFINLWAIFHDPRYFEEPEKFIPERFLKHSFGVRTDVHDDPARRENLIFGGGRRVCPGIYTGKAGLEINVANFLWGFDFSPARSPSGESITPDLWAYTEGVNMTPLPFAATIKVRSAEKANIIDRHFYNQSPLFAPFEQDLTPEDKEYVSKTRG